MSQSNLVVVQSYATEGEAEVAKGVLESSGIDAMIQADTVGRMREHLFWSGLGHRVLVREEDEAAARGLLALPQNDELGLLQYATETWKFCKVRCCPFSQRSGMTARIISCS
jgi:Putative prokaryotic signal transducing protein